MRIVLAQPTYVRARACDARANLHPVADRPRPEEADAILTRDDQAPALLSAQLALLRAADIGRDVVERLFAAESGQHAFAIVPHDQCRAAAHATPLDDDMARMGVDGVLHQLGD